MRAQISATSFWRHRVALEICLDRRLDDEARGFAAAPVVTAPTSQLTDFSNILG